MKIKEGLLLKEIAGNYIIVPLNDELVDLNAMININDTGAFLFKLLQEGSTEEELCKALTSEYDVSEEEAKADISDFIRMLTENSMLM